MRTIKKIVLVASIGVLGLLLTLAGFNLITLSQELLLYVGFGLLGLAVLYYFLY